MKFSRCYRNSARLHEELLFLQALGGSLHEVLRFLHEDLTLLPEQCEAT